MDWKILDCDVGQCLPYVPKPKPILGSAIAAGVGLIGSIAGSAMTNSANSSMDQATREWQEKMWRANNEYNSPVNLRKRLEQAGINPALAFQSGSTGVASSAPSVVQHTPADWSGIGTGISQGAQYMLQASQVRANNDLLKSQADAQRIENLTLHSRRIAELDKMIEEKKRIGADTQWLEWQRDRSQAMYDAESKNLYHQTMELDARARQENANAYLLEIDARFRALQNRTGIKFSQAQMDLFRAQINSEVSKKNVLDAQTLYHILDNAKMLPDVKTALRISDRMDDNPNETQILDALGLWLDPVTEAIDAGTNVYNARSTRMRSKPHSSSRSRVKRETIQDSKGNWKVRDYSYE